MWDSKNTVNQCVKCFCKFTTAEQPLKLLPCLHSMCLDCLYGRFPTRRNSETADSHNKTEEKAETPESVSQGDQTKVTVDPIQNGEDEGKKTESGNSGETMSTTTGDQDSDVAHSNGDESAETGAIKESDLAQAQDSGHTETSRTKDASESVDQSKSKKVEAENPEAGESETTDQDSEEDVKPKPATECPVCHDPIDSPGMMLMDNMFATLAPVEDLSPSINSTHVCTACEEGQQANSYCVQCEEWLCDSCVDAHKRVRITKDHIISPKDQVQVATAKSPWEQLMMCKQHKQEQLKFFCEKCEKLTCRDCQLMDHKDHKYQFLDQAAELYRARLKGSLALMGEKRSKLTTNRDEIEQKLSNCKEQKDTLQQDILRQADILVKGIRQAVWSVLSNLASFTDAATKRLNKEIDDVSDLIRKFEHCIQFMEDILTDGSSMSLLYSKGNVEAKCRKVYHTQVDPQSLKGTLLIQYKHDVNWLLGNLNKIGAIFVNGVRYPPEKNGGQANRHAQSSSSNQYGSDQRSGIGGTSPHLQHMANQQIPGQRSAGGDWTKYIQTASKPSGQIAAPPNMTLAAMGSSSSLPPQLTLPSNRRAQASAMGPQWQAAMPGSSFPPHFPPGQMHQPQPQQAIRPSFTPMRLHHRPAAHPSSFPSQTEHGQNMRSPPQYRMGGEASGSSRSSHGTPDPARPASAGMYDNRPDSGGGPAIVDIKKERRDQSPDCVITSSSMRSEKQVLHHTSPSSARLSETVLEMQRNLDDVIRNVPMDLSDNLEQISGSKPPSDVIPRKTLTPPPPLVAAETRDEVQSPTDEELRENWQGGNSMPGFSLAPIMQGDPNDDYCACCHNGGDVLCCDKCPKVYHLQCHIPELPSVPSGSFVCTICEGDNSVDTEEINSGKRKAPGGLSDQDVKVCERILLELFCHPSSVPFQEPVNRAQVPNYYKIIIQPVDFTQIKCKLQRKHNNHYQSIKAFLYDLRQVFINCAIYNKVASEVGKAGQIVRERFEDLVGRFMPQYLSFVKENPSPMFSALQKGSDPELGESNPHDNSSGAAHGGDETQAKRIKLDGSE